MAQRFKTTDKSIYYLDSSNYKYIHYPKPQKLFFIVEKDTITDILVRFKHNEKLMDRIQSEYAESGLEFSVMSGTNVYFEKEDYAIYFDRYILVVTQKYDYKNVPYVDVIISSRRKKIYTRQPLIQ